jgi:hypothetical protein
VQSIEVKPPPMTTTRLPLWPGYSRPSVAVLRYSRPSMHAVGVLVRDAQLVRVVAADRHEHRVEALVLEVVQREVAAQRLRCTRSGRRAGDRLVLGLEHLHLGQAVLRDAVAEHAARCRVALEDVTSWPAISR